MKKIFPLSIIANIFLLHCYAQGVAISSDGLSPHSSAMLDIRSLNKGMLVPRVALTGTTDVTTVPSPAVSLLIYNTAANGSAVSAVIPGYYYWNGIVWLG